jgi:hypothetical protein
MRVGELPAFEFTSIEASPIQVWGAKPKRLWFALPDQIAAFPLPAPQRSVKRKYF